MAAPTQQQQQQRQRRVAVIGSGVAGIGATWLLSRDPDRFAVTLYEADGYFGGHTHTVDVPSLKDPSKTVGVDTGFIVCNPITYPNFLRFLNELNVAVQRSDMSFSVSRNEGEFEWCGDNVNTVFAQRRNLLPVGHGQRGAAWGMYGLISEIVRFHEQASAIATEADALQFDPVTGEPLAGADVGDGAKKHPYASMTLGEFFARFGYSKFFYQNYVLPMTAAIWSTPADMTFDKFPLLTLVRFMRNHIMLQIGGRPKWRTVYGGSRTYVDKVLAGVADKRLNTPVARVRTLDDGHVAVTAKSGATEVYDHVIFATHADQALAALGDDATPDERRILGAVQFVNNRAVLHRDASLMPKRRLAWASWNYLTAVSDEQQSQSMCLTYWMNRLQPFVDEKTYGTVLVTMNPLREPDPKTVLGQWDYTHPLYSPQTIAAQDALDTIQNKRGITFAGAWTNYGFHEDGITSGLLAALSLGATCPFQVVLNGGYPTHRVAPAAPAWAAAAVAAASGEVDATSKDASAPAATARYRVGRPLYANEAQRRAAVRDALEATAFGQRGGSGAAAVQLAWWIGVLVVGYAVWSML